MNHLSILVCKRMKFACNKNRFFSSRYNFRKQKLAFLPSKITRSDGGVITLISTQLCYRCSRYNFIKQKLAFLLYKITRSDGGENGVSLVLDTFFSCKSRDLRLKNTRSDGGGVGFLVLYAV
jgi:hypothetical protein